LSELKVHVPPTQYSHFGDVLLSQSLDLTIEKPNPFVTTKANMHL